MSGRVWATLGFLLGVLVSIAGNVAHTWHPTGEQLAAAGLTLQQAGQWRPAAGAQLFAAFFPAALLVTVEVLARVSWPSGWAWTLARFGGAGLVALVAAVVSYLHLSGLLAAYGEDRLTTWIGPLAVDGLMVVCGFALLAIGRLKGVDSLHSLEAEDADDEKGRHSVTTLDDERVSMAMDTPGGEQADTLSVSPPRFAGSDGGDAQETVGLTVSPDGRDGAPVVGEEGAEDGRGIGRPSGASVPAQPLVVDIPSAVVSARAAGLSLQRIADEFGVTKYQVTKILKGAEASVP